MEYLQIAILGIIEGITEFLPVSSTGHLLIAEQWLPRQSDLFNVLIQSGAVLAVFAALAGRVREILKNWREPKNLALIQQLSIAFGITLIGGGLLEFFDFELPETIAPVATATLFGGIAIIIIESWRNKHEQDQKLTWQIAVALGIAQIAAAIFPGLSRSGTTILVALCFGVARPVATEFSFLLGAITLLAAGALKLITADLSTLQADWGVLLVGTLSAAITAFVSVKWLLGYVQRHTFTPFGWYRIILGGLLLFLI